MADDALMVIRVDVDVANDDILLWSKVIIFIYFSNRIWADSSYVRDGWGLLLRRRFVVVTILSGAARE